MQIIYCAIKAPQWYAVQGSDTTMMTIAASLFGQLKNDDLFIQTGARTLFHRCLHFLGNGAA